MVTYGDANKKRFEDIVKGKLRKDLKDMISNPHITRRVKDGQVSIPLPQIDIPRFKPVFPEDEDGEGEGGVGQGQGNIGDKIAPGSPEDGEGGNKAGEGAGEHSLEVEVTIEELAQIMKEELELPNIKPKGKKRIYTEFEKYSGLRMKGPDGLMRFPPSYKNALLRQIASGEYDPDDPIITIRDQDKRYRSWKTTSKPESDAVIMHMMDVSGSMTEEHKAIARQISFWIDIFLRHEYKNIESVYIIHDTNAVEVDRHTFYNTTTSGGTRIASAYELCLQTINLRYNPSEWNIYPFQWSDGDNWGNNEPEFQLLNEIIPLVNLFCYGQIDIPWWSGKGSAPSWIREDYEVFGKYYRDLEEFKLLVTDEEKIRSARITGRDEIYSALKEFLGTGR
ncbi:MAG: DUF444 family protein [archaeon]